MKTVYVVHEIESERGWGSKVEDEYHFDTPDEAKEWADAYNKKFNPPGPAPDWYMYAKYVGQHDIDDDKFNYPKVFFTEE